MHLEASNIPDAEVFHEFLSFLLYQCFAILRERKRDTDSERERARGFSSIYHVKRTTSGPSHRPLDEQNTVNITITDHCRIPWKMISDNKFGSISDMAIRDWTKLVMTCHNVPFMHIICITPTKRGPFYI